MDVKKRKKTVIDTSTSPVRSKTKKTKVCNMFLSVGQVGASKINFTIFTTSKLRMESIKRRAVINRKLPSQDKKSG